MGNRGRTSSAELAVIGGSDITEVPRAQPPKELTDEQRMHWKRIVGSLPADHFPPERHGMLAAYCRHIVSQNRIAQMIEAQADEFDVKEYDLLLKMQERESRCMGTLAIRLNIAKSGVYESKGKPKGKAPWQYDN